MGSGFNHEEHLANTFLERADLIRYDIENFQKQKINFRLDSVLAGKGIANMELMMGDKIIIYSTDMVLSSVKI